MNWKDLKTKNDVIDALEYLGVGRESFERRDLAFKCITKSQEYKDQDLEFDARMAYIKESVYLGLYQDAIAMFPWFLNVCDKQEDYDRYTHVLWTFKWIINALTDFHTISLEKIQLLFDEFERRYRDFGTGDKVINYFKAQREANLGHVEKSLEYLEAYLNDSGGSFLDDCAACQPNNLARVYIVAEEYEKLLELIKPILDGKLTCHVVPHTTYHKAVLATMMLGDWDKAEHYTQLAYKYLDFAIPNLHDSSTLLLYHSIKKEFLKCRNLINAQLNFTADFVSSGNLYDFFFSCYIFMKKYIAAGHQSIELDFDYKKVKAIEPLSNNTYNVEALKNWFNEQAKLHINRLDVRNENRFLEQKFVKLEEWVSQQI